MKLFSANESFHRFTYGAMDDTGTCMATNVLRYFEAVFIVLDNKFCSF
jgi:hypothetical protein